MDTVTSNSPRRSGRAFFKMKLQAQGRGHDGRKFRETCETVVVNAHGALILLKHEMDNGGFHQPIVVNHSTDRADVDGAMQDTPAATAEAANPAGGGCNR